jgi:hypothetical protein
MVDPDGRESPSWIGAFRMWQQPHPISCLGILYSINTDTDFLEEYQEVVFEIAESMAAHATWVEDEGRYVLGPPLIPPATTKPRHILIVGDEGLSSIWLASPPELESQSNWIRSLRSQARWLMSIYLCSPFSLEPIPSGVPSRYVPNHLSRGSTDSP